MPRWRLAPIAVVLLLATQAVAAETTIKVRTSSGREFEGVLDSRTNSEQLWLRWQIGQVELQRPILWERIVTADISGGPIEIAELQRRAEELSTPGRTTQLRQAPEVQRTAANLRPIVRSIRCTAWLANWDADADFDGLMVEIEALDADGIAIDVQGTVAAELITLESQPAYLGSTSGGRPAVSLGNWSQPWSAQRSVRLELQGRQPPGGGNLGRYALLKLKVTIPGSGVFEQQVDGFRLRPYTPVGNQMWR
jgi:hypothetical protein